MSSRTSNDQATYIAMYNKLVAAWSKNAATEIKFSTRGGKITSWFREMEQSFMEAGYYNITLTSTETAAIFKITSV